MAEVQTKEESGIRSFGVFLGRLADGEAQLELTDEWHKLLKRSMEEAQARGSPVKGKLTLELTVQADPRSAVAIGYDIKTKEPPKQRAGSVMFLTRKGTLTMNNPRQCTLPLREVKQQDEARDVEDDATVAREV